MLVDCTQGLSDGELFPVEFHRSSMVGVWRLGQNNLQAEVFALARQYNRDMHAFSCVDVECFHCGCQAPLMIMQHLISCLHTWA